MIKVVAIFLALLCLSCSQEQGKTTSHSVYKIVQDETKDALSPKLAAEIKSLSNQLDSLTSDSMGIVAVLFSREDQDCTLLIATQPFYDRQSIDGGILVGQRLFVFYVEDSLCNMGIVHLDQLQPLNLDSYPNEQNYEPLDSYEPWGRKYKIHSNDSLELIKCGYL